MELIRGIKAFDLGCYIQKSKLFVISDLQLGYEESLNRQGVLVPRFQYEDIVKRLEKIFAQFTREKINIDIFVINGDLKHEFGRINTQEWREILKLFDYVKRFCKKIIVVKGNHDLAIEHVAEKRGIEVVNHYIKDGVVYLHGHAIPKNFDAVLKEIKTIIIGHEHPAVRLRDKNHTETYKCFLKGKYKCKDIIVLPSFNPCVEGSDILTEQILSPFLTDIKNFEVFVVEDKTYKFGKVKNI